MGRAFQNRKLSMAKTAGMKTKIYSKYGKEIYVCAKSSGPDPDSNLTLRRLIENAKKDQVPTHVIERAIEKAAGAGGEDYERASYEGFGPGNCMVIVECLTDNGSITITSGFLTDYPNEFSLATGPFNSAIDAFVRQSAPLLKRGLRLNVVSPAPVVEASRVGTGLVSPEQVAKFYAESLEGNDTGKVFRAWGGLPQTDRD